MKVKDLHGEQLVALVKPYHGLKPGLQGTVIGYYSEEDKALVQLFNRQKTHEKIPLNCLIGIVSDEIE